MRDFREQNFYELLDVHPQASQQELDRAYQRARRIFNPDSVATYALFQPDELNLLRRRIEEAFRTLSDPERRAAYDQELARLDEGWTPAPADDEGEAGAADTPAPDEAPEAPAPTEADAPPAEETAPDADKPAPKTEPEESEPAEPEAGASPESEATAEALTSGSAPSDAAPADHEPEAEAQTEASVEAEAAGEETIEQAAPDHAAACECPAGDAPAEMPVVEEETEVTGALLLQARLAKGLSLDDYVQVTKISIYYLRNIEEENFSDLPATVYTRGYLRQMAQLLGLDPQRVSSSYLERKARLEAEEGK